MRSEPSLAEELATDPNITSRLDAIYRAEYPRGRDARDLATAGRVLPKLLAAFDEELARHVAAVEERRAARQAATKEACDHFAALLGEVRRTLANVADDAISLKLRDQLIAAAYDGEPASNAAWPHQRATERLTARAETLARDLAAAGNPADLKAEILAILRAAK